MSWDLFAFVLPPDAQSVEDIPSEYQPPVIGPRASLAEAIARVLPEADLGDPGWGRVDLGEASIVINLGEDDPVGVALHVRGSGDHVPAVIQTILDATGTRALDASTGELFAEDSGSFEAWQAYRDRVLGDDGP